jgi:hypothetical protein
LSFSSRDYFDPEKKKKKNIGLGGVAQVVEH